MSAKTRLLTYLTAFDGKAVTMLSEARVACRALPGYWQSLVAYAADDRDTLSRGATWIIKAELEDGGTCPQDDTATLIATLESITDWQAALHICQCGHLLNLDLGPAQSVSTWAMQFETHRRPFLRGWSLSLRAALGAQHEALRMDGMSARAMALQDAAASVRARAKHMPDFD